MAHLLARLHVLGTGDAEGTGPTLLLTTHRRGQYSSEETLLEVVCFNCGECSCRVANASHIKLAATTAVLFTRVAPSHVSGLPSLLFHLSTAGAASLAVHGPAHYKVEGARHGANETSSLLDIYMRAINSFVVRQFPDVSAHSHSVPTGPYSCVHDSTGSVPYSAYGRSIGAGVLVWAIPVQVPVHVESAEGTTTRPEGKAEGETVQGSAKRRRVDERHKDGERPRSATVCCYLVTVRGPLTGVGPNACTLLLIDCPRATAEALDALSQAVVHAVKSLCRGNADGALGPTLPTLVLHLGGGAVVNSPGYADALVHIQFSSTEGVSQPLLPHARHVFLSSAAAPSCGPLPLPQPGASSVVHTHFPSAVRHTIRLHASCPLLFPLMLPGGGNSGTVGPSHGCPTLNPGEVLRLLPVQDDAGAQELEPDRYVVNVGEMLAELEVGPSGIMPPPESDLAMLRKSVLVFASHNVKGGATAPVTEASNKDAAVALRRTMLGLGQSDDSTARCPSHVLPSSSNSSTRWPPFTPPLESGECGASITLCGTGAAAPSSLRSCSAIHVALPDPTSAFSPSGVPPPTLGLLLDCGEGALGKLQLHLQEHRVGVVGGRSGPVAGLALVWISHLHADHHSGLANVLSAHAQSRMAAHPLGSLGTNGPLRVHGPGALLPVLQAYAALITEAGMQEGWWAYPLGGSEGVDGCGVYEFVQIGGGRGPGSCGSSVALWRDVRVEHSGEAYGAVLVLDLQAGTGAVHAGRHVVCVYSGDTRPCQALIDAAVHVTADTAARVQANEPGAASISSDSIDSCISRPSVRVLLVHEATFAEGGEGEDAAIERTSSTCRTASEHARAKRHSTVEEAVQVASKLAEALQSVADQYAGVELSMLPPVLTHFSARYAAAGDVTASASLAAVSRFRPWSVVAGRTVLMAADGMRIGL